MMEWLDLTRILDETLPIYTADGYSDPPLHIVPWCNIASQGYLVSQISLGTQTGTHIDAPAHFAEDGDFLDALPLSALIGPYRYLDLSAAGDSLYLQSNSVGRHASILFLAAPHQTTVTITQALFERLLALPCPVWVTAVGLRVERKEDLFFHHALAMHGRYLIEDLEPTTAARVRPGGELIALPLRLGRTSGAPCRVVIRQPLLENQ